MTSFILNLFIVYVYECVFFSACIYEYNMCASYPQKPDENIGSLRTGETDQSWELNPGPSQEQQMLLTAKPSLQIPSPHFFHANQSTSPLSFKTIYGFPSGLIPPGDIRATCGLAPFHLQPLPSLHQPSHSLVLNHVDLCPATVPCVTAGLT